MWAIEEQCPKVCLTLCTSAPFVAIHFFLHEGVRQDIYHVHWNFLVLQNFHPLLHEIEKACVAGFALKFVIEREEPSVADCAVIEPRGDLTPKLSSVGPLQGFGLHQVELVRSEGVDLFLVVGDGGVEHIVVDLMWLGDDVLLLWTFGFGFGWFSAFLSCSDSIDNWEVCSGGGVGYGCYDFGCWG